MDRDDHYPISIFDLIASPLSFLYSQGIVIFIVLRYDTWNLQTIAARIRNDYWGVSLLHAQSTAITSSEIQNKVKEDEIVASSPLHGFFDDSYEANWDGERRWKDDTTGLDHSLGRRNLESVATP